MNKHLPFELAFELKDKEWSSLSKKEQLTYINWCLVRLKANYWVCEEKYEYKYYLTRQINGIEKIKKDVQKNKNLRGVI